MAKTIDGGSVVLLIPETAEERAWLDERVGKDNGFQPYWPDRVVVEPRYLAPILEALLADSSGGVQ